MANSKKIRVQDLADLYKQCAGIDVHKESLSVCVIQPVAPGQPEGEVRAYGTTTRELRELTAWLKQRGVTHVAMESTGVYWVPVWQILEEGEFQLVLANARAVRNVPVKKTDTADCVWLATLLRKGLIQASYIPPAEIRALRDLCRAHSTLVRERVRVVQRLQALLETANLKLDSVISDLLGKSGRQMLDALAQGETDPGKLAALALGRMRSKRKELVAALEGHLRPHQKFLLQQGLVHFDQLNGQIDQLREQIEQYVRPFEAAVTQLAQMPGLERLSATKLLAETGADLQAFPSPERFCSWAAVCPGNRRSAGKQRSGRTRQGNPWLRSTATECAWAASRSKNTYFHAQYHRLAPRIGKNRAILAVAHSMLYVTWHLLRRQVPFQDLGGDYFQSINQAGQAKACLRKLQKLGYKVTLEPTT